VECSKIRKLYNGMECSKDLGNGIASILTYSFINSDNKSHPIHEILPVLIMLTVHSGVIWFNINSFAKFVFVKLNLLIQ